MKSFTVNKQEDGLTAIKYCKKVCPGMPGSLLHKSFRKKRVKINGKRREENTVLKAGDFIELYFNDEFFSLKQTDIQAPKAMPDIIYEDDNIIIVHKPRGLLCHSDNKNQDNLIDMITFYLQENGQYSPDNVTAFTPSLCNRIDQGTEGMVIAAKNYTALSQMNSIIRDGLVSKKYLCITQKHIPDGEYTAFLSRDKVKKTVSIYPSETDGSKKIITEFRTLEHKNSHYLVECNLITGRTHQIRAHLAYLGSPILGDKKYGKSDKSLKSQLLCAYKLTFGDIPDKYALSYLSGKEFVLQNNDVADYFKKIN